MPSFNAAYIAAEQSRHAGVVAKKSTLTNEEARARERLESANKEVEEAQTAAEEETRKRQRLRANQERVSQEQLDAAKEIVRKIDELKQQEADLERQKSAFTQKYFPTEGQD